MDKDKMFEDIENKNTKGNFHGYQQWCSVDVLWFRGNYKNEQQIGYSEYNHHCQQIGENGTQVDFYIR